jgi:hypothetical protein
MTDDYPAPESLPVTIDHRSLHAVIVPALERCLSELATDLAGAASEGVSFRVYRALETYGLECIRAAERAAAERNLRPELIAAPSPPARPRPRPRRREQTGRT